MAIESGGATAYVSAATIPVTAYPYSVIFYVNCATASGTRYLFEWYIDASNHVRCRPSATTNAPFMILASAGSGDTTTAPSGFSTDTWVPVAMTLTSATDRTVYVWDAIGGTRASANDTTSRDFVADMPCKVCVGATSNAVRIQDYAIVDVALNTTQLDEWAAGLTALATSFESDVVGYQPLVSAVNESGYRGPDFSVNGSPSWVSGPTLTGPATGYVPIPNLSGNLNLNLSGNLQ